MAFSTFNGINIKTYTDALNNVLESAKWNGKAKSQYNAKYALINNKLDTLKSNIFIANAMVGYLNEALKHKGDRDNFKAEARNHTTGGVIYDAKIGQANDALIKMNKAIANAKSELESMKTVS